MDQSGVPSVLEHISTRWPLLTDPGQFVLRYAPAIRRYLGALLRDPQVVEDVSQDFFLRILDQRFVPPANLRGRFRDYLKASVRNAALGHWRKEGGRQDVNLVVDVPETADEADKGWLQEWRHCLLERAWDALDAHERRTPGNLCHTVLRIKLDYPDEDSPKQAARVEERTGKTLTPEAFRKQLSRARQLFARCLVREAAQTIQSPTGESIAEELGELQLLALVQPFLPADWVSRPDLLDL